MIRRVSLIATACLLSFGLVFAGCGDDDGGSALCGNGICEPGETAENCPQDCGCGNGVINTGEDCDGDDLGGYMCTDLDYEGGNLGCNDDCTFDTSGCYDESECGNGIIEQGEDCDSGELGGATCESEGFDGGTLACNDSSCRFDITGCCYNGCSVLDDTRCSGDVIQTCTAFDNGCMDWADTQDCSDDGLECVMSAGDAVCDIEVCVNQCPAEDVQQCDGDIVQTCVMNLNGCLEWVGTEDCSDNNETCVEDGDTAYCEGTCENECTEGQEQCDGTVIQTCEQNQSGCWVWVNGDDCADTSQVCVISEGTASCSDTCINECPEANALQCNGDILEICEMGADNCLHWVTSQNCADTNQVCDDSGTDPVCVDAPISGDDCDNPIVVDSLPYVISGTDLTADFSNSADYSSSTDCGTANGVDAFFQVSLLEGESMLLRELGDLDVVVRVISDCDPDVAECLLSFDYGEVEGEIFTAPADGDYIVVLEAYFSSPWSVDYEFHIDSVVICDPDTEFTCDNGECIPLAQVCDGTEQCTDGSDEWNCGPGERCGNPEELFLGANDFTGTYDGDPVGEFCVDDTYNAFWAEFTAPADGLYEFAAQNNTSNTLAYSRLVILDGTGCSPYDNELICETSTSRSISGSVSLTNGQTVLVVFTTDGDSYTMLDPEITITELCNPYTEFTCDNGECIPLDQVCDGTPQCTDDSDETLCELGERCQSPHEVFIGENYLVGDFTDDPALGFSCKDSPPNTVWLEFTAPADGDYELSVYNTGSGWSRMAVMDGLECSPYGAELLCNNNNNSYTITETVSLTNGQTILIAAFTEGATWTMLDPEITITPLFDGYTIDWCAVTWPESINGVEGSMVDVYGEVYIDGVTPLQGSDGLLVGMVGVGPEGIDPNNDPSAFTWYDAWANPNPNPSNPNNDEYVGEITVPSLGTYNYVYAFSGDGGYTWTYCDGDGGDYDNPRVLNSLEVIVGWDFETEEFTPSTSNSLNVDKVVEVVEANFSDWVAGFFSSTAPNFNGWDNGAGVSYWMTEVNTEGYENISVSAAFKSSNTGPRDFQLQYRLGEGGVWIDVADGDLVLPSGGDWLFPEMVALPAAVDDYNSVYLRWLMVSDTSANGGTVGSLGTNRIDDVMIVGVPLP